MKIIFESSFSKLVVNSLLMLGLYVILSVGVGILPKFGVGWYEESILKFNTVILNLSYSYVAGMIFYLLINYMPDQAQKRRFQPFVKKDIKRIHSLYLNLINSMSTKKNGVIYNTIPSYQIFEELMECISPNEIYPNTSEQIIRANYMRTFFYLRVETLGIIEHIYYFKNQVPDEIILLLEELNSSEFFSAVTMWNSFQNGFGNENMKLFAQSFYDGFSIVEKLNLKANNLF